MVLLGMVLAWGGIAAGADPVPTPTPTPEPTYLIGPSDILEVIVWREENLSRNDILVRPDGKFSMTLVDDVQAAGLTPMQLKAELIRRLGKYMEGPQVYVIVKDPRSQYFCVLGNVVKAGVFPMLVPTDVLQALSTAGGFNEWAHKDDVIITRKLGDKQEIYPFEYSDVIKGDENKQNIRLLPGDVVVVP
ncbi:MAG: polysaccharide export protein [Deltaproteobacteria bacterium]|nr:polysaccharide export protein [Deltaproteobacteria bacterium]